jgi:hypothetical protein
MEALAHTETWTVELTAHCVERFRERFCPGLDLEAAEDRLANLLDHARFDVRPPTWLVQMPRPAAAYLVVGDDLALPLLERGSRSGVFVALTCLARGGITHAARARRKEHRARQKARRR